MGSPDAVPPQRTRILVGAPVFQAVYPEPFEAFLALMVGAGRQHGVEWFVNIVSRTPVHDAMNTLFERAVREGMDGVIWFDDDCGMPVDAIPRLVDHLRAGRDFVAGVGFMRNFPHTTTVGRWYPEGITLVADGSGPVQPKGFHWLDDLSKLPPLATVDFCGFPIAVLSRRALLALPYPWFHVRDDEGGSCTHDIYFCKKLQKAGIPVLVDTTLQCRHLAPAGWMDFPTREWARLMSQATATAPDAAALKARLTGGGHAG